MVNTPTTGLVVTILLRVGDNCLMTEQLWGIGGVVVGIAATGGTNWLIDRSKHRRESSAEASAKNKNLCEEFLTSIESELEATNTFAEKHGDVFPGELGYDQGPANARARLTEIELKCPKKVHTKALTLAKTLEAFIWTGGTKDSYFTARTEFIAAFRSKL